MPDKIPDFHLSDFLNEIVYRTLYQKNRTVRSNTGLLATVAAVQFSYDTRCYFNVRTKADMSQLSLPRAPL